MYHIVVVASNQEETSLLTRVRECFTLKKTTVTFSFVDSAEEIPDRIANEKPDYVFIDCNYSPEEQLERITAMAAQMKKTKRIIPLVYCVDWKNPLPSLLGTAWTSQVGILHTYSSKPEIIDLFQRLDGWGVTVGL